MARPKPALVLSSLFLLLIFFQTINPNVSAQNDHSSLQHMSATETIGWPLNNSTFFDPGEDGLEDEEEEEEDGGGEVGDHGRTLLYYYYRSSRPRRYYISYGALAANRIPCPPRSGRSYYTHHCYRTRRPVNPYSRGCSAIPRCRR